jgi:hypothetical protein
MSFYDPERFTCPICDSIDVQFIISRDELPPDDPLSKLSDKDEKKKG